MEAWLTLLAANLGFLLLILIPGLGLSYLLRPSGLGVSAGAAGSASESENIAPLGRGLRLSFGLALGFIFPVVLFYVLGILHLYYEWIWILAGLVLSGFSIQKFGKTFLMEWREGGQINKSVKCFYGLLIFYFLCNYLAFFTQGVMDYDILFGQVAPAVHLFFEHVYRPFDMGAVPIVRHEFFPGPISFHSAFMAFGEFVKPVFSAGEPWVAVSAVMVLLAPLMLLMVGKFSESLIPGTEFFTIFMTLTTFLGFRIKNGRGTVLALIFLFGFLLLPKIFEGLSSNTIVSQKNKFSKFLSSEILKPSIACAIFVALSLYTNIEIGAILLGVAVLVVLGSWLSNNRALMNTVLFGTAGGFLLYFPWFLTVSLLTFNASLLPMLALYFGIIFLALLLTKLPKVEIDSSKLERILLIIIVIGALIAMFIGAWGSLFRLPDGLKYLSAFSTLPILYFAFRKPDLNRHGFFIYSWLFAILFIDIYPLLQPAFAQVGLPEKLQYFLFDKPLGSVFPELRAKIHEYFLPSFALIFLSGSLVWIRKNWLWQKWTLALCLLVFFYFTTVRFQESDFEEYPRGQTFSSLIYYNLATEYAFAQMPIWLKPGQMPVMEELNKIKKPGDKIFNFYAIYNPYYPEHNFPYLITGVGTVPLNKEDLVSEEYTVELLDQVIAAGANYAFFMPGPNSPEVWLADSRVKVVSQSADGAYILAALN